MPDESTERKGSLGRVEIDYSKMFGEDLKQEFPLLYNILDGKPKEGDNNKDLQQLYKLPILSSLEGKDLKHNLENFELGSAEEARAKLEEFVKYSGGDPKNPEVKAELDNYQAQMGNIFKAAEAYEKYAEAMGKVEKENVRSDKLYHQPFPTIPTIIKPLKEEGYGTPKENSTDIITPKSEKDGKEAAKEDKTSQVISEEMQKALAEYDAAKAAGIDGTSGQIPNHNSPDVGTSKGLA